MIEILNLEGKRKKKNKLLHIQYVSLLITLSNDLFCSSESVWKAVLKELLLPNQEKDQDVHNVSCTPIFFSHAWLLVSTDNHSTNAANQS